MPTEKHDDGGPVHPMQFDDVRHCGMTLWDYYAAAAMDGLLASYHQIDLLESGAPDYQAAINGIALEASQFADSMIAERRKRGIGGDNA